MIFDPIGKTFIFNLGLHLSRSCTKISEPKHGCDPNITSADIETATDYFCTRRCPTDGCNRHTIYEIPPNSANFVKKSISILILFSIEIIHRMELY